MRFFSSLVFRIPNLFSGTNFFICLFSQSSFFFEEEKMHSFSLPVSHCCEVVRSLLFLSRVGGTASIFQNARTRSVDRLLAFSLASSAIVSEL